MKNLESVCMVWDHFLLAGLYTVILTKKTVDSQLRFNIGKVFQVSFKFWTTCVRQTHLSRPLSFHCAAYSIWRCHILIGVRNSNFAVFSPKFSWLRLFSTPYENFPQPLKTLLLNSLSKLHSKIKGYFSFSTVFFKFASAFLLQTPLQTLQ